MSSTYPCSAPDGSKGFDADRVFTDDQLKILKRHGFEFCLRYVSLHESLEGGDLSAEEATRILDSGLALMPVQHRIVAGDAASATLGNEYGTNAVAHAKAIGFPPGVNLWADLEGLRDGSLPVDVAAYCSAWYDAVSVEGYIPGLYVGDGCILKAGDFESLKFEHYWKSGSSAPDIPNRGYQMIQAIFSKDLTLDGEPFAIDIDVTGSDSQGNCAIWLIRRRA